MKSSERADIVHETKFLCSYRKILKSENDHPHCNPCTERQKMCVVTRELVPNIIKRKHLKKLLNHHAIMHFHDGMPDL